MKKLLTVLTVLSFGVTTGNFTNFSNTNIQKENILNNYNQQKTQQDTIYIDKKGKKVRTNEKDLSNFDTTKIIQIGFYPNEKGEIQVVKMPKTIKNVPDQLPPEITSLNSMFYGASVFNQDISKWNTSNVRNMKSMFYQSLIFNQDISKWDTSNVTNMSAMFYNASSFNKDISKWDTSNVINMSYMFSYTWTFNQDISKWNTSNVTDISYMFSYSSAFNQNLSKWDTSNVTNMSAMFYNAYLFNNDISKWDTSNVTNMSAMFYNAYLFNNDISKWDTSNVTNMSAMFFSTEKFNQDISKWNTSNVRNMKNMFSYTLAFNQDISKWNTSNVRNMKNMFSYSSAFNQNLSNWDVSNVIEHIGFAASSAFDNLSKLPKFLYNLSKFYFNLDRENLTAETSWGKTRNNSFIYTFKLSKKIFPTDFKFIKFYNKDGSLIDNSYYSWGNTRYYSQSINNAIKNNNLINYLRNVKVTKDGPDNPWNSCNIIICNNRETWPLAAVLRINIEMGLTFYEENGSWFFQIIITHYGQTWGSQSGGSIWTPLGSYFVLS